MCEAINTFSYYLFHHYEHVCVSSIVQGQVLRRQVMGLRRRRSLLEKMLGEGCTLDITILPPPPSVRKHFVQGASPYSASAAPFPAKPRACHLNYTLKFAEKTIRIGIFLLITKKSSRASRARFKNSVDTIIGNLYDFTLGKQYFLFSTFSYKKFRKGYWSLEKCQQLLSRKHSSQLLPNFQ